MGYAIAIIVWKKLLYVKYIEKYNLDSFIYHNDTAKVIK